MVGRVEHHAPVQHRRDALDAPLHVAVPQLEVALPRVVPLGVEVVEDVEAPVEAEHRVLVEVGVDVEEPAGLDPVEAAAAEVGVGDEPGDPGELLEEADHGPGVELAHELAGEGRHHRLVVAW